MLHTTSAPASFLSHHNDSYLRHLHLLLNQHYYQMLYGEDQQHFSDEAKLEKLRQLESSWIDYEKKLCLEKYDCHRPVRSMAIADLALTNHAVSNHPIFDYFCFDANLEDLKQFIANESVLNVEFFDYLLFAAIGAGDEAKAEIMANLWDEAGRGDIKRYHTTLFKDCMHSLGLQYDRNKTIAAMSWEGLAGINLFSHCALYSVNKMKYFGLLAATEMLDPAHYKKLINGIARITKHTPFTPTYYTEHETIDVEHASGWMQKVVIPELQKHPEKTQDFWLGFYMRLDSALRYYDSVYAALMMKNAA